MGVVLACALALPQALARSADPAAPSAGAATDAPLASEGAAAAATVLVGSAALAQARLAPGPRATATAAEGAAASATPGAAGLAGGRLVAAAGLFRRVAAKTARRLQRAAALRRLPPLTVRRVIAAGNRIAHAPYSYGGGHGNWNSGGYDCSGSISYALHGGGLLDTALASGAFMSWGEPGPGRWITIYANPGHAFMVVAGRRFDTTGREQTGSRWQRVMRDTSGYAVRHPPGL